MISLKNINAQTTLEYIIIIALVAIAAIAGSIMYYHATSGTSVGTSDAILAVGYYVRHAATVALSQPLPTTASNVKLEYDSDTSTNQLVSTTPTYVDNYPEYTFEITKGPPYYISVTGITYTTPTGENVTIPTETGSPIKSIPETSDIIQP